MDLQYKQTTDIDYSFLYEIKDDVTTHQLSIIYGYICTNYKNLSNIDLGMYYHELIDYVVKNKLYLLSINQNDTGKSDFYNSLKEWVK